MPCAALASLAQSSGIGTTSQQAPAPVVRKAPAASGATGSTAPVKAVPAPQPGRPSTILMQSFPVGPNGQRLAGPTAATGAHTAPASTAVHATTGSTGARAATGTPAAHAATGSSGTVKPAAPVPQVAKPAVPTPAVAAPVSTPAPVPAPKTGTAALATLPATSINRAVVVLDPGHGGSDSGSRIGDNVLEKDVTLAFAFKLRSLLQARGLTVVMTRDTDAAAPPNNPGTSLTLDERAGIANHVHASACLLLHATGAGTGVHLYNSELSAVPAETVPTPWLTAQAAWVSQSERLEGALGQALTRSHVPLVTAQASVRPVDSMTCPALIIELAPQNGDDATSINDASYQQQVGDAIASTLVFWQRQVDPPQRIVPTDTSQPTSQNRDVGHPDSPASGGTP